MRKKCKILTRMGVGDSTMSRLWDRITAVALLTAFVATQVGCFDPWVAYGDMAIDPSDHDLHDPETLARSMLRSPNAVAYSDDGEHFALHRCRKWRDGKTTCQLAFGERRGINELWPVLVPAPTLDGAGARAIVDALADRLDDVDAHRMTNEVRGSRAVLSTGKTHLVVTLNGTLLRLGQLATRNAKVMTPLAAAELTRGKLMPKVRAVSSYRRNDAVAVELWVKVDEKAVESYNVWVLFFLKEDGRWTSAFVRNDGPDAIYHSMMPADTLPKATPESPVDKKPPTNIAR